VGGKKCASQAKERRGKTKRYKREKKNRKHPGETSEETQNIFDMVVDCQFAKNFSGFDF